MKFILQRLFDTGDETLGMLYSGKNYLATVLEDEKRFTKVKGETRIDPGTYNLVWQETITPLTKKYRDMFPDWFDKHIMLKNTPRHSNIYIHFGNFEDDTDGCVLTADGFFPRTDKEGYQLAANSRATFEKVYKHIGGMMKAGKRCYLEVRDEHWLTK